MTEEKHTPEAEQCKDYCCLAINKFGKIHECHTSGCVATRAYTGNILSTPELLSRVSDLEKANAELLEKAQKMMDTRQQYQFFVEGYANGSASISEVKNASQEEYAAYCEMFDLIKLLTAPKGE